jgi:transposase InsO family protein
MSREDLVMENLAMKQQLGTFIVKEIRPTISNTDRLFWVFLSKAWDHWADFLVIVKPETVVRWHKQGFKSYWQWKSRRQKRGRPRISTEIQNLIRQMTFENNWGAPRIHGELLKLGFEIDERTVSRYMPKRPPDPEKIQRWITFLKNHRDVLVGMDFFVVPTTMFKVLYAFFIISHARRKIVQYAVTPAPVAEWIIQQLREAFPFDSAPKYAILDRDRKYGNRVPAALKSMGVEPKQIAFQSPWQNGVAERFIESIRRDLLDHVVVFNEAHLHRLLTEYIAYYHDDRTHLGLAKDTPTSRPVTLRPSPAARVVSLPRVGGLHHKYEWRDAA